MFWKPSDKPANRFPLALISPEAVTLPCIVWKSPWLTTKSPELDILPSTCKALPIPANLLPVLPKFFAGFWI